MVIFSFMFPEVSFIDSNVFKMIQGVHHTQLCWLCFSSPKSKLFLLLIFQHLFPEILVSISSIWSSSNAQIISVYRRRKKESSFINSPPSNKRVPDSVCIILETKILLLLLLTPLLIQTGDSFSSQGCSKHYISQLREFWYHFLSWPHLT